MSEEEERLHRELEQARSRYEHALEQHRVAQTLCRTVGMNHPDGAQALRNSNRTLAWATNEFHRALSNFSALVLHRPTDSLGHEEADKK